MFVPPASDDAAARSEASAAEPPAGAAGAVLVHSEPMPEDAQTVRGYDFNRGVDFAALINSFGRTGFQASNLARAVEEVEKMRNWRLSDEPLLPDEPEHTRDRAVRAQTRCKIFLGYTSNLVSSGLRETIRFLVQHSFVDCIVTSAGGIEEDIIKCLGPTYLGDFELPGSQLRSKGLNRIGNLLVPNDNYCRFEDWVMPVLDRMLAEQNGAEKTLWTPSKVIRRLGKEIADEESIYYWAYKVRLFF
ncbi:MAG: deoxyhypusine synthase [Olpidium bornovanus]|uniref:deoxyhypusine synthase n=1 Tax=Olpidium bornovanus TaxID=278681 RepID=A0A8H7ZSZ4_9FUNG|nr:MAG: deoxyhypusine synthase [Olpidium bornovanus]